MNIKDITAKYDQLLTEQKQTLNTMNNLINLAEQLLFELQRKNGGLTNASH